MSDLRYRPRVAVAIIIVGRNVGRYGALSVEGVFQASAKVPDVVLSVIAIDDCSSDDTRAQFNRGREIAVSTHFAGDYSVVSNEVWRGFSLSILAGLREIDLKNFKPDLVLILPGNHQVEVSSIVDLLTAATANSVTLGYRVNKRTARPPLKWLSSCVLQLLSGILISRKIRDITGQFLVPPNLLRDAVVGDPRHAWSVRLSRLIVDSEYPIREIPINLIDGFRSRPASEGFRRSPRTRDILSYLLALIREFRFRKVGEW